MAWAHPKKGRTSKEVRPSEQPLTKGGLAEGKFRSNDVVHHQNLIQGGETAKPTREKALSISPTLSISGSEKTFHGTNAPDQPGRFVKV